MRMNEFFASVFFRENLENIPSFEQIITDDSLTFLQCSVDEVTKLITERAETAQISWAGWNSSIDTRKLC